jgi:hypothetical protein
MSLQEVEEEVVVEALSVVEVKKPATHSTSPSTSLFQRRVLSVQLSEPRLISWKPA